ncbi:hypothetical protein E6W17_22040 [Streptomyces sp. A1547]|nr:hypothetical protein E6W17_22040 [Streptomyces sp. A1547]
MRTGTGSGGNAATTGISGSRGGHRGRGERAGRAGGAWWPQFGPGGCDQEAGGLTAGRGRPEDRARHAVGVPEDGR